MTTFIELKEVVQTGRYLILDTETTGLEGEIVQIAIINQDGEIVYDGLVKPARPIPPDATAIHGIDNDMVRDAPAWDIVRQRILTLIVNANVLIYNMAFDLKMMVNSDRHAGVKPHPWFNLANWHCAMLAYAEYFGDWNDYRHSYRWQRLSDACQQQEIAINGAHSALGDCKMTLALVKKITASK